MKLGGYIRDQKQVAEREGTHYTVEAGSREGGYKQKQVAEREGTHYTVESGSREGRYTVEKVSKDRAGKWEGTIEVGIKDGG